jgi:hypothetical protein
MKLIEDDISLLVQNHFPKFYEEQGNTFVEFVREYYNWTQQTNNNIFFTRNLLENRDIDTTIDDFLYHYKQKYLAGAPVNFDRSRFNIKHVKDFYRSKGTERGTKLFLNRVYGVSEASLYFPGTDVLKASDGEWVVPTYLEVSLSEKSKLFVGKTVVGSTSGATAFVEGLSRKVISGQYLDILYLSNVSGYFTFDEILTVDGNLVDCPRVVGSLTKITLNDAGREFAVGDVVDVVSSSRGKQGKARIDSVEQSTGKVTFTLLNGGTGYRLTTNPVVAEKMLTVTNKVSSNTFITNFITDEYIYQPLANIVFSSSNTTFTYGQLVTGANSTANVATGRVVGKIQSSVTGTVSANSTSNTVTGINTLFTTELANNAYIKFQSNNSTFQIYSVNSNTSLTLTTTGPNVVANTVTVANGSILVTVASGNWSLADRIYGSAALIDSYQDKTAYGVLMGSNVNAIGISNVVNTFTANQYNFIYGSTSNVYANVSLVGTGTGAGFDIGSLTDEETVYLNSDIIGGNNSIATVQLTGSISCNTTSSQVNGSSTLFTTELYDGAYIKIGSNNTVFQVNTISNNTILNLKTNAIGAVANTISITSGAYLTTPLKAFKYGFPKLLTGNSSTLLNLCLTRGSYDVGTISSLTNINPGSNYNISPFVLVRDREIASFNRRNLHLTIDNKSGTFTDGEELVQNFSRPAFTIQTSGSNSNFLVNESVTQKINSTANGYGLTSSSNGTISIIEVSAFSNSTYGNTFVNSAITAITGTVTSNTTSPQVNGTGTSFTTNLSAGDFIKFSGNNLIFQINTISNNTILNLTSNSALIVSTNTLSKVTNVAVGMTSGVKFFVNNSIVNTQISLSRGTVINSGASFINVTRKTFNQSFTSNVVITGSVSGATANVTGVTQIADSSLMGNNAVVNSFAGIVNGSITSLSVLNSGYAYQDGELITLQIDSNQYVATGYANLINQGIGEGYFKSTRGFLNSDKYIHDGDFYQFFSYQVSTDIPLETYGDTLKKLMHIAGTKLFGSVTKVSNVDVTIKSSGVEIDT